MEIFYTQSSNYVKAARIRQGSNGAALTSITSATAVLLDAAGDAIAGSSISLAAVSGEDDSMAGIFPTGLTITQNSVGAVKVTVNGLIAAVSVTRVAKLNVRFNNGEQD